MWASIFFPSPLFAAIELGDSWRLKENPPNFEFRAKLRHQSLAGNFSLLLDGGQSLEGHRSSPHSSAKQEPSWHVCGGQQFMPWIIGRLLIGLLGWFGGTFLYLDGPDKPWVKLLSLRSVCCCSWLPFHGTWDHAPQIVPMSKLSTARRFSMMAKRYHSRV